MAQSSSHGLPSPPRAGLPGGLGPGFGAREGMVQDAGLLTASYKHCGGLPGRS